MIMGRKREYHETFLNFSDYSDFLALAKQEILDKCVVRRYNIIVLLKLADQRKDMRKVQEKVQKTEVLR